MQTNNVDKFQVEYRQRIDREFLPYVLLSSALIIDAAFSTNKGMVKAWVDNRIHTPLSFEIAWHWLDYGLKHTDIRLRRKQVEHLLTTADNLESTAIMKWIEKEIRRVI